jgi:hypothetical protein
LHYARNSSQDISNTAHNASQVPCTGLRSTLSLESVLLLSVPIGQEFIYTRSAIMVNSTWIRSERLIKLCSKIFVSQAQVFVVNSIS